MLFWSVVLVGILLVVSFFLSLSETALIALSRIRLRHLVIKGVRHAKTVNKIVSHLDRLITSILVGNNIVNVGISAIATGIFIYFLGPKWGVIISTIVVSFLILVFAEITPKLFASQYPEKVSLMMAKPINALVLALRPVASIFMGIGTFFLRFLGGGPAPRAPLITEEEIKIMIEVGKEEGAVSDDERKMLHKIFKFGDTMVGEVMMSKENMIAVRMSSTPEELLGLLVEGGHSRIPVYRDSIDTIAGIIYAKDLLQVWHDKGLLILSDLVQPAYFVKRSKKVTEVLKDMQRMKVQIAIVVDENKKTQGLVTLEDLLEEIVGEIEEEV